MYNNNDDNENNNAQETEIRTTIPMMTKLSMM